MILGITGGIGSGKSYISRLLTAHFAIPVYDSDIEARRLMVTSEEIRRGLVELIGPEAYAFDGTLCKPVVACYLFASEEHAVRVNSLVHPAVKADFMQWAASHVGDVAFESAILVEAGFRDAVDYLVTVTAPVELRFQRAMRRDGVGEEQIRERMVHQCMEEERLAAADFVIVNDGRDLMSQLNELYRQIKS